MGPVKKRAGLLPARDWWHQNLAHILHLMLSLPQLLRVLFSQRYHPLLYDSNIQKLSHKTKYFKLKFTN